ncbi:MmgE/PrpD family protein [Streptomyces albus]|nr:MmgE/PrpD family protein [Streptomyces albus]
MWRNALGLAFAMPNWPLMRAFLASDARLFNTFTPVRTAMDSCDGARAGLQGAVDILEHPDGFLDHFASVPLPDAVNAGLGERWHTETLSFKMHPGGPGVDAAVDCAAALHRQLGPCRPEDIEEVVVEASLYTLFAGKKAASYIVGPGSPLGALVLHTPYPVATALLTGGLTVNDFAAPLLNERARWNLAERVRLVHDPELTKALFASDAPFGEAVRQAGEAAWPWLRSFAGDEVAKLARGAVSDRTRDVFTSSAKATGARVTVRMADGRTASRQRMIPIAAAGPHTRAHHAELMREKFLEFGGSPGVADGAGELESMDADALRSWIESALR